MGKAHFCWIAAAVIMASSCKKDSTHSSGSGENKPPIANAGPDQTIMLPRDNVRLNGSLSHDPDGGVVGYRWTTLAGPNSPHLDEGRLLVSGLKPSEMFVSNLKEGVYQFELMVMDKKSAIAKDTMSVTVLPDSLTLDPSRMKRFDSLLWGDSCAVRINNISATVPAGVPIQVFMARYYGGGVFAGPFFPPSGWYPILPVSSSGSWYEIKNDVLIIHAANIDCNWDDAVYDVLVRWN